MTKLFAYYFKKKWHYILIFTFITLLLAVASTPKDGYVYISYNDLPKAEEMPFTLLAVTGGIFATIIPIFEHAYKNRKVNLDQLYALPVRKTDIFLAKFLFGLVELIIPILVSYSYLFLTLTFKDHIYNTEIFVAYLPMLIFGLLIIYTITTFIFNKANTIYDGIISIIGWNIALPLMALILFDVLRKLDIYSYYIGKIDPSYFFLYSPLTLLTNMTNAYACGTGYIHFHYGRIISYSLFTVLAVAAFFLSLKHIKDFKAEDAGAKSDSWFLYKFLIPTITCAATMYTLDLEILIIFFYVLSMCYFLAVLYRRGFNIFHKIYIELIISVVLGILLNLIIIT